MRTLPIWKTFSILIIVFHSRAYSTFSNNEASSPSAFSYDAELEPLVLGPDRAALSIYSHEAESHPGSLVAASDDLNSSDFAGEDQAGYNNGGRTEIIRNGYDECTPKNRRNRSKMRVRQLSCPFERMQNSKGPATGQGQRIRTAPGRKVEPDQIPEIEPYIPLQILKSDEETCLPATTGKGNFYSASNTPVCSTGLDQIKFPPTSRPQYFTLQECFPYNPWYKCLEPEFLWCCGLVTINYPKARQNMMHDLHNSWVYTGQGCVPVNPPPNFIGPRGLPS